MGVDIVFNMTLTWQTPLYTFLPHNNSTERIVFHLFSHTQISLFSEYYNEKEVHTASILISYAHMLFVIVKSK